MEVTFDLTTPQGAPAEALNAVIEARRKELGETAMQSCVAMAEGILRSLRAQTKIAKEGGANLKIQLADDKYFLSFKREKGNKRAKRILRSSKMGTEIHPEKVVWRMGKYTKGEVAHSYEVVDQVAEDKVVKYIIVTHNQKEAREYAKTRHSNYVKRFKGLARTALSLAMKAVYDKANEGVSGTTQEVQSVAASNTSVVVNDTGFNSGVASVYVHDNLEYAIPAMKNGESSVNEAIAAALRKAAGYIQQRVKRNGGSIDQSLKTTLDELIGAQR